MARRKKERAPARKSAPLGGLSANWYWEQDAAHRFTRIELQAGTPADVERAGPVLGKRRWETGIEVEGGWEVHREILKAQAPFREVLMWRELTDGGRCYASVSGEPVFDRRGRFAGYRGVARDVTRQKRGEQLLRLQQVVTRRMAEATGGAAGVVGSLRAICATEGWDCGEFWRLDEPAGVMRRFAHWAMGAGEAYAAASAELQFAPGEGLVGGVWQSGEPLWISDTGDARAALACPVESGGRVSGVLAFACSRIRAPDDGLLDALTALATQLGLFLRRADAEAGLRQSEERFRRTFELAGVGVAHIDLERRFQRVNRRFCEILGYTESELIGITGRELSHPDDKDAMNSQRPLLYAGEVDAVRGEKRYLRKDGAVVWVAYVLAVERDAAGKPLYEIAVYDDISARKAMEEALRDSEGRFRSLTHLSSDWFWEQDAEYRFTRLEGPLVAGGDPLLRERLLGARRWESGLEVEGGWEAHRALLDARKPFHDALMWRAVSGGGMRFMHVSGEPMFSADGRCTGYRGVGREVTEEKRAEQLLRLEHRVSSAQSEARSTEAGVAAVMRLVCEAEGWACCRYFEVDHAAGELVYRQGWSAADPALERFLHDSERLRFKRGQGLSGRVWQSGEPLWSTDTGADDRAKDKSLLAGATRGAFVFGAAAEGEILAVLSFTSRSVRKPDERLFAAARVVGAQVGQFVRRMKAEARLRESEARFRSLTEMSSDFFWETDAQHRFVDVVHGPASPEGMGRIVGHAAWELPHANPDDTAWKTIRTAMDAQRPFRDFEFGRLWPDGSVRYFSLHGEPRFAPGGGFVGYRGVGRDVTDVAMARERIATLAYHDALTGLDNRTSLAPALEKAVERTRRRASRLAGLFLDLDGFKEINDAHGHDAGDRLLVEVARRLRAALRSSDPVARLGGDEFFVVLEDIGDATPAERVAKKLLAAVQEPYDLGVGAEVRISASIGLSVVPDDAGDAATLMKHADAAMYAAKQAGKNGYRFFAALPAANDLRDEAASERGG